MDPDAALQQLREYYNLAQDGLMTGDTDAMEIAEVFDDLDNWITGGGFLPAEWQQ